ncbi:uncharacterized protein Tco025E_01691 [Trypanosoma conorhini]|uniref:Uncharacterized protein n=1 Tax=Trypanosoma conorhini TaxID=83891 RepID=A0A422Q7W5_9TRYP|nr:uncharacterized protein Tco025E_01691 [Trypanosoma conorhini]RNF26062.1 hypothetical protein Tco025E_01691 [Trypanosoma conorhini]
MQEKRGACNDEASPPLSSSRLAALRHTRLLPRSIPASFALRSQLIGAEFCASLSAAMLQLAPRGVRTATAVTGATSPATALLYDLSAHYGSHTLRRAASYPLGPCYSSRQRRVSRSQHDGRRQLWSLRAAHRLWCRRCGVYLAAGETKLLLPRATPGPLQLPDDAAAVTAPAVEGLKQKGIASRGTYVCRRCLDSEWAAWRKKGCLTTPPPPLATPLAFPQASEAADEPAAPNASDIRRESVVAQLAVSVGRTRRRKRKKRGGVARTAAPAVGNASASLKAAARAVPKGSLSRGKRSRTTAPKDPVPLAQERFKVNFSGAQRDTSNAAPVRKAARVEGSPATLTVAPRALQNEAARAETEAKSQVPTGPRKSVTKSRRSTSKGGNNSKETPSSANTFTDTLSRLGL